MMREFSMHILDIAQNSVRAEATYVIIEIVEDIVNNIFSFSVEDNGKGMSKEMTQQVRDPFTTSRTTRKIGLGIPMLEQTCIQCGGHLELESELGKGTFIKAVMQYNNIDRPPLGELASTIQILMVGNPKIDFRYIHLINGKEYVLDTKEIKEILDGVPLDHPDVIGWLKENLEEGIEELRVS